MKMSARSLRVGFVGLSLASYLAEKLGYRERSIDGLKQLSQDWQFDLFTIDEAVQSHADAERAAAKLQEAELDFLLIQNTSISIGDQLIPLIDCAPRLGIWSLPDPSLAGEVQLHSLVALQEHASILKRTLRTRQLHHKWFYDHVDSAIFLRRFGVTVRALQGLLRLENAHIGSIGGVSPGFYNLEIDPRKIQQQVGVTLHEHDMEELVHLAEQEEQDAVTLQAKRMREAAAEVTVSNPETFQRVTRVYLALKRMTQRHQYDALAVQCWSRIQELYGIVPCMAYSWLGSDDNLAVSCEGDIQGAISMLLLNELIRAEQSSTLLDLAAFDPNSPYMMMFHCGVTPRHFADEKGIRWVDHVTLGRFSDEAPVGVAGDLVFAPQADTTISYLGDDCSQILVARAKIVSHEPSGFDGTRGWFADFELNQESISHWDLFNSLIINGHEHHFAVCIGDVTDELLEFANWKGLRLVKHIPYRDHLQCD